MTFADIFTVLACITFTISSVIYIRDVAQARVTPSIATFGVLSLVNFSQLISLIDKEVWHVVPFTIVGFLQAFIVFVIAIRGRRFYFGVFDMIALVGALIGYVFWIVSQDAAYNIYVINIVTAITFVPLIIKAFREPALETKLPWQTNLLASTFLLLAITSTAPYVWIVPVRQFVCSLLINIGIATGKKKKKKKVRFA